MTTLIQRINKIEKILESKGFYYDDNNDMLFKKVDNKYANGEEDEEYINILYDSDQMRSCCGITEIADFSMYSNSSPKLPRNYDKLIVKLFIQSWFLRFKRGLLTGKRLNSRDSGFGVIFVSNAVGHCKLVDDALAELKNDYVCVPSVTNKNSRNILNVWVSKHC